MHHAVELEVNAGHPSVTSCKKKYKPRSHEIVPRRFATLNQRSQVSVKDALLYTHIYTYYKRQRTWPELRHCVDSDSASPEPGKRRRATVTVVLPHSVIKLQLLLSCHGRLVYHTRLRF